jgi:hypothetical protein
MAPYVTMHKETLVVTGRVKGSHGEAAAIRVEGRTAPINIQEVSAAIDMLSHRFVIRQIGIPESTLKVHKNGRGHEWFETNPDGTTANNFQKLPWC